MSSIVMTASSFFVGAMSLIRKHRGGLKFHSLRSTLPTEIEAIETTRSGHPTSVGTKQQYLDPYLIFIDPTKRRRRGWQHISDPSPINLILVDRILIYNDLKYKEYR